MKTERAKFNIVLLILASFFGVMEMTVIITALPTIGKAFPQAGSWLPWLTTASLMAAAIAMPLGGKIADDWGVKKAFLLGLILLSLGSFLAGLVGLALPNSITLLIIFRLLQGFGGGTFAPVGFKLISIVLKGRSRTQTMGLAGTVSPLAAVLGPNIGGFVVSHFPWQIIFLTNAGIGLAIALLATFFMDETHSDSKRAPLDVTGIGIFSAVILSAMLALTLVRQPGKQLLPALVLLIIAAVLAFLLYRLETHIPKPFLDPALSKTKGMRTILALSFLQGFTMYSTLFFLSFYAQTHPLIRATPIQAGALLTPGALSQIIAAPLVGRFIPRTGYRFMVAAGMLLTAGSLIAMTEGPTSLIVLATLLSLGRVGGTMASIPLAAAGLEANVERAGAISGLRQLSNVLGGVVGPLMLSIAVPLSRTQGVTSTLVFLVMALCLLIALPATRFMPSEEAEVTPISWHNAGNDS